MLAVVDEFYEGGARSCILERLCASVSRSVIRGPLQRSFDVWLTAFETLGIDAGIPRRIARARAEDALARIEGALVVVAGTGKKRRVRAGARRRTHDVARRRVSEPR